MESYDEILTRMKEHYRELSGFAPENESDIMLRLRVLAGEVFKERAYADYIMRQMFPTTAEGSYLDEHAAQRNITRKAATKAVGTVLFSTDSQEHGDIVIPAGTVVCTTGDMKRFVTDRDAVIPFNLDKIGVAVTAARGGSEYNVGVGTVGIIVTPVLGVDSVTNLYQITGGTDAESDDQLRQRIKDSFVNISNGTNEAYYCSVAMSVDGVYSASAVGKGRGIGTVDVYVCGKGTYVPIEKRREIETLMRSARELNVDVRVLNPTPVTINLYIKISVAEGYDFSEVSSETGSAVEDYINSLGIGKNVLLSDIGEVIYHIKGVTGYKFLESYGSDRSISKSQYPVAGSIVVADH